MLRWFRAPRLNQKDAALIAGVIARVVVEEQLTDLEFIEQIENLLERVVDSEKKYKRYKITNEEAILISKQAGFLLDNYRKKIEEHIRLRSEWSEAFKKYRSISINRRFESEATAYLRDTHHLSSFPKNK